MVRPPSPSPLSPPTSPPRSLSLFSVNPLLRHLDHVPRSHTYPRTLDAGRLAMIGIISFATAVAIPGSVPFYPF